MNGVKFFWYNNLDQGSQTQSVSWAAWDWKQGLAGRIKNEENLHFSWCSRAALDPLARHMQPAGRVFETADLDHN